jgi:hypothetical protein
VRARCGALALVLIATFAGPARAENDDPVPPPPQAPPGAVTAAPQSSAEALPPPPPPPPGATGEPAPVPAPPAEPRKRKVARPRKTLPLPSELPPPVDEAPAIEEPTRTRRHWYGWQTLLMDGASVGLMASGAAGDSGGAVTWGALGYVFGAPIVHGVHDHGGKFFASLGARVGFPLVGALIGAGAGSGSCKNDCSGTGALVGLILGMGGAIAFDAAVIAREDAPEPELSEAPRPRVAPAITIGKDRAEIWLGGTF